MLKVEQLTKKFGGSVAVDTVSFTIGRGEIFSLIGPNSSGKTTIVKTIAGLLRPNNGRVTIGGYDVVTQPLLAKHMIGYIPDEPSLWSGITGEEFLHFVGALYGMDPKSRTKKIAELLPIFHLEGIEKDYFENYSRGNKQKFSILAAVLHEPKLLLIDEPIVGLDPESAGIARRLFAEFAKGGGSVLLVTHTLAVAELISTRIGVLKNGVLIHSGTLSELRQEAKLKDHASLEDIYTTLTT